MAEDRNYSTALDDEEASRLLKKILSPAEAQSLVLPPPDHAPRTEPGKSTPLTGNLARPPSQASPARSPDYDEVNPQKGTPARGGLAGYFAAKPAAHGTTPDRSGDPQYIKVSSKGQVGYLPKANLRAAMQIDGNLKVLDEP
jgi:hypothetical protein